MDTIVNTLILVAHYTDRLSYYDDWLEAFEQSPNFRVTTVNICAWGAAERLRTVLPEAEAIILLHSTNGDTTVYLEPIAPILADRNCPLVSFVGNEVNLPGSPISAKRDVLMAMAPDFVATQLLLEAGEHLWGDVPNRGVIAVPHALNPDVFTPGRPQRERRVDIGVRAVRYIAHLGDRDRNLVHDLFAEHSFAPDLVVDIGSGRLDRAQWAAFLQAAKATVSSEAGSWWLERDDATIKALRAWTAERISGRAFIIRNDSPLRKLGHKLPWWMRAAARKLLSGGVVRHESTVNEDLAFDEIWETFFKDRARPAYYGKCISSRHFDAIGTGTVQILLAGRYNDLLEPGTHYLELSPEFTNLNEVMDAFADDERRQQIADAARQHVLEKHTYRHRTDELFGYLSSAAG